MVEWARIELKETWDPQASLKTICAFANDVDNWGGGYLVIGVSDNGEGKPAQLKGVPDSKIDAYLKDMLNKCKLIQPSFIPITEVAEYKDKKFIVVWAPGGSVRPYSSPKVVTGGKSERIYWIRKMASTIAPSEEERRELYNLANLQRRQQAACCPSGGHHCCQHEAGARSYGLGFFVGLLRYVGLRQRADAHYAADGKDRLREG